MLKSLCHAVKTSGFAVAMAVAFAIAVVATGMEIDRHIAHDKAIEARVTANERATQNFIAISLKQQRLVKVKQ